MRFTKETMAYLHSIAAIARKSEEVSRNLGASGVSAAAILGAIGEELEAQGPADVAQAHVVHWFSHEKYVSDIQELRANPALISEMVDGPDWRKIWLKFRYPVLNDIGPGNLKILTAIELLEGYQKQYPNDDPMELKHYSSDYARMVSDLKDQNNSASVRFTALMLKEGDEFYSRTVGSAWNHYDPDIKSAVLVTWYNNGREWAARKEQEFRAASPDGQYAPRPGGGASGGEIFLANATTLKILLDPGFPLPETVANGFQLNITNAIPPAEIAATDPDAAAARVENGSVRNGSTYNLTQDPAKLSLNQYQGKWIDNTFAAATSQVLSDGFRPGNINLAPEVFDYSLRNATQGLGFNPATSAAALLNSGNAQARVTLPTDPLVLDLDGDGVQLTDYLANPVLFDIDNDGGSLEEAGWASATDGIVVVDLNGNGKIDHVGELLSEYYGGAGGVEGNSGEKPFANGFAALKSLDSNGDDVFDAQDTQWSSVQVWVDANHDGKSWVDANANNLVDAGEASEVQPLAALGITSIDLRHARQSGELRQGNEVLARGTFMHNGVRKEALAANFLANPNGHTITANGDGVMVATQGGGARAPVSAYSSTSATGETIDLAQKGVNNASGGAGNDTLIGDTGNNWLAGGLGADSLQGGAGDDVLLIDADDLPGQINGGEGSDIVQVLGDRGVQLNLAKAQVEMVHGGRGNDVFVADGDSTVYMRGGQGDDLLLGGRANDALSGEEGDDFLSGNAGNDVLRGHRGKDQLLGGEGDDLLDGGLGDDSLKGGAGHDVLIGGAGDDEIDGGEGIDVVELSGEVGEYRFLHTDEGVWISDTVTGRDGTDLVRNVEKANFSNLNSVILPGVAADSEGAQSPLVIHDRLDRDSTGNPFTRMGPQLIGQRQLLDNDIDRQGDELRITELFDVIGGSAQLTEAGDVLFTPDATGAGAMEFKYTVQDSAGFGALPVVNHTLGLEAVMRARVQLRTPDMPDDQLIQEQWYLERSAVVPVWTRYAGTGVRIGQLEPGGHFSTTREVFDFRHPDLKANVDPRWLAQAEQGMRAGEGSEGLFSDHATAVGGVMVAARNGRGSVGVAPGATLAGFWVHKDDFSALNKMADFDVINNSWGSQIPFDLKYLPASLGTRPPGFQRALAEGRGGLGTVIVIGAGNDRAIGGNANYSNLSNSTDSIIVGAVNAVTDVSTLALGGKPFSSPGASILVSAPGSNITTTARQVQAASGAYIGREHKAYQGTSFATPIVAGVVALMLEANPRLGYRDVQDILAASARQLDDPTTTWQYNASQKWNGGGMHVSHDYGYGEVDAQAAVRLAETWDRVSTLATRIHFIQPASSGDINLVIADNEPAGVSTALNLGESQVEVEHVEVKVRLTHARPGDLILKLISPSGTESILMDRPGKAPGSAAEVLGSKDFAGEPTLDYVFTTALLRGESTLGDWTLKVIDAAGGEAGVLHEWSMNAFGKSCSSDHYLYTDEFARLAGLGQRKVLKDTNGGIDTVNTAAMSAAVQIDLSTGTATLGHTPLTFEAPDQFEHLIGTDLADTLIGNQLDNRLVGGRGADTLSGREGIDTLVGGLGNDVLTGGTGVDTFIVAKAAGELDTITDFAPGEDRLVLSGFDTEVYAALAVVQQGQDLRINLGDEQAVVLKNVAAAAFNLREIIRLQGTWDPAELGNFSLVGYGAGPGVPEVTLPDSEGGVLYQLNDTGMRVFGGSGPDRIVGGQGDDTLVGDNTTDGDQGSGDTLYGGEGSDVVRGGPGNDVLYGGPGLDYLGGDAGDDVLHLEGDVDHTGFGGHLFSPTITLGGPQQHTGAAVGGGAGNDRFVLVEDRSPDVATGVLRNLITDFEIANPAEKIDLSQIRAVRSFADLTFGTVTMDDQRYLRVWMGPMQVGAQYLSLQGVSAEQLTAEHFIFGNYAPEPKVLITGTAQGDTLVGDAGGNTLDGLAGADIMEGRSGDDTYGVDDVGDVIHEVPGGGYDQVNASVSHALASEVEVLQLMGDTAIDGTGNALPNRLYGNTGNNRLDGGKGSDVMHGGRGDDTYVVDDGADQVVELAEQGVDTVRSSVSFTLGTHLENLILVGDEAISGTGNRAENQLVGNAGNNRLDGAQGADRMEGLGGDDRYVVDHVGDVIIEAPEGGRDEVLAMIDYVLPAEVENLQLGGKAVNATGNTGANELRGNALANRLYGDAGNDYLVGGAGDDRYVIGQGHGDDIIAEAPGQEGGVDTLVFEAGIAEADVRVERSLQGLLLRLKEDQSILSPWTAEQGHGVERIEFANGVVWDTATLAGQQADQLVQAMASFAPPAGGTGVATHRPMTGAEGMLAVAA